MRERWAQLILSQKRSTLLRLRAYPLRVCSNSGFWPKAKVKIAQMNVRCLRERADIELLAAVAAQSILMMRGRIKEAHARNGLFCLGGYSDVDRWVKLTTHVNQFVCRLTARSAVSIVVTHRWLVVGSWRTVAQHNVWLTLISCKGGNRSTDVRAIRS